MHHMHMDVVKSELAEPQPGVDEVRSIGDVQSLLRPMIGRTIEVVAHGVFVVPIKKLPKNSLIRPRFFKTTQSKASINTAGMVFDIEGPGAPRLSWTRIDDKDIRIELLSLLRGKIDEEYLVRFFRLLNARFEEFVFGETRNEPGV